MRYIQSLRTRFTIDSGGLLGSALLFGFALVAFLRWRNSGLIFYLLLTFRDILLGISFLRREPSVRKGTVLHALAAYISTGLPLVYFSQNVGTNPSVSLVSQLLAIVGFLVATLAAIELGSQIGVSPAIRGQTRRATGIYRILRHPMYVGYVVAEFGQVLINPVNFILFVISTGGYWYRANVENKIWSCQT